MSDIRRVYLDRRRPCWLCSKPLQPATAGPATGRFVAAEVEIDGLPRLVHLCCLEDYEQEQAWAAEDELHRYHRPLRSLDIEHGLVGWQAVGAPPDQEAERA